MKKVLLFEPWHLGDVAVALSITKPFMQPNVEFSLVCNRKWKDWALSTSIIKSVIEFTPPWTQREEIDKYNPLNYKIKDFQRFKKEVLQYEPDVIFDLRGDIRAKSFLKLLFGSSITLKSSKLRNSDNVYRRGEVINSELNYSFTEERNVFSQQRYEKIITLFFGASDSNRMVPIQTATSLILKLHDAGYKLNLILQPTDDLHDFINIKEKFCLSNLNLVSGDIINVADVLKKSSLVISTDSGWLHIGYFYNKPLIGLFGFDTMKTWLPPSCSFVTGDTIYPDHYRYKKKYQQLKPLVSINTEKIVQLVDKLHAKNLINAAETA